ncbi:hypothetical protein BJ165DRAFT_1503506, partial [Panaeolus papilionaceus]
MVVLVSLSWPVGWMVFVRPSPVFLFHRLLRHFILLFCLNFCLNAFFLNLSFPIPFNSFFTTVLNTFTNTDILLPLSTQIVSPTSSIPHIGSCPYRFL